MGFCIDLDIKRGFGTNVELDHIEPELIQDMMQQEIKNNRPRLVDETLIFPDGAKSGKLEDDEAYLYDLARGK